MKQQRQPFTFRTLNFKSYFKKFWWSGEGTPPDDGAFYLQANDGKDPRESLKTRFPRFRHLAFTCGLLLAGLHQSHAQAPTLGWNKTIGGTGTDRLQSMQQTADGGYILGGFSDSGISGDKTGANMGSNDFWVVKLHADGSKAWDKTFGGNAEDKLTALQQTSDGGYILGGISRSGISGDKTEATRGSSDYWVVKLDAAGNKIWDKTFGGSYDDNLAALQQTSDGGYILGGESDSPISGDKTQAARGANDYWVVKINANGLKIWDNTFGGNRIDYLTALQQTSDGGYILGGYSNSGINSDKSQDVIGGNFGNDYWVVKLDAAGNKIWDKTFGL